MKLPQLGDILLGKYRLDEVLGEGGFGVVYRGVTLSSQRPVAIKVLKPGSDGYEPARAERFLRELRTVAQLTNPHTVTLYDHGRTNEGVLFMVCEMVEGEDLTALVARRRLSDAETVHVLRQVLESLREAHHLGVLHRDVKPANIRVFQYQHDSLRIKVLDFGLAKSLQAGETALTAAGKVIGTPQYMSPEQLRGRDLTPATDIYSLGLVAYEMLTGRGAKVAFRPTDQPRLSVADPVRRDLRLVINKMLEYGTEKRFATADDTLRALADLRIRRPAPVPEPVPPIMPSAIATNEESATEPVTVDALPETIEEAYVGETTLLDLPAPAETPVTPTREALRLRWFMPLLAALLALTAAAGLLLFGDKPAPLPVAKSSGPTAAPTPPVTRPGGGCDKPLPFVGVGQLAGLDAYIPPSYRAHAPLILLATDAPSWKTTQAALAAVSDDQGIILLRVEPTDSRPAAATIESAIVAASENLCVDASRMFGIGVGPGRRLLSAGACETRLSGYVNNAKNTETCPGSLQHEVQEGPIDGVKIWLYLSKLAPPEPGPSRACRIDLRSSSEARCPQGFAVVRSQDGAIVTANVPARSALAVFLNVCEPDGTSFEMGTFAEDDVPPTIRIEGARLRVSTTANERDLPHDMPVADGRCDQVMAAAHAGGVRVRTDAGAEVFRTDSPVDAAAGRIWEISLNRGLADDVTGSGIWNAVFFVVPLEQVMKATGVIDQPD